jgi:hypothetical protein
MFEWSTSFNHDAGARFNGLVTRFAVTGNAAFDDFVVVSAYLGVSLKIVRFVFCVL